MKLAEQIHFRIEAIKDRRPDGFGEPRSLRVLLDIGRDEVRSLERVEADLRGCEGDEVVESILSDLDQLRSAIKLADGFLAG